MLQISCLIWCDAALVKALGCSGLAAPVRAACADCACEIVHSLAAPTGNPVQMAELSEVHCEPTRRLSGNHANRRHIVMHAM